MTFQERIACICHAENLSELALCEMTGVSLIALNRLKLGLFKPDGAQLYKITSHPRFYKYTLWLLTNNVAEDAGQIAPTPRFI